MELYEAMKQRRSRYDITSASPISDERLQEVLADAVTYTPSAFHSQSARVLLLLGARHQKLWQIVLQTLRPLVPKDKFQGAEEKINSFAAGHGTVLYFEDSETVRKMQEAVPLYAENFPVWSNQSAGMLQYAVWTALAQEGLGASLQHYNPLIDAQVAEEFGVPAAWKLLAQMPFGTPAGQPKPLERQPIEQRFLVQGETT